MEWPCGRCSIIKKHPYGHYYSICEGCKELEEYEMWMEQQEVKRLLNIVLQKARRRKRKEESE